jgi:two-component system response regulator FlrC
MINGPSGTGKEVLARFVHAQSARAGGPFVAINCAAIPATLIEATLFGHEKGAFTGAQRATPGKFEQAQGGTLLLDEISELDLGLQAKLLRVLQERELERVGGHETIELDVRVLATSNRNLREEVAAGRFREDLFYRLNVFPLTLPPLRERPRDILPLARALLQRRVPPGEPVPDLAPDAAERLERQAWPGNVRELDNVVQRALVLRHGPVIRAEDLRFEDHPAVPAAAAPSQGLSADLRSVEGQRILEALHSANGSRLSAAELLGISPRTLRYKLARLREAGAAIPR